MKNAIFMVLLAALCVALLTLAGCAGSGANGKLTVNDSLLILERGHFKGEVVVQASGAPLSFNNKLSLGPDGSILAKGEVDFSKKGE